MQFRKKPVIIEAFRYGSQPALDWFHAAVAADIVTTHPPDEGDGPFDVYCMIAPLEGKMRGNAGDWIIQGITGEIYPCKAAIFDATYEAVEIPQHV